MTSQAPLPLEPHELALRLRRLRDRVDELRGRL
jgi:hypothetical protein